MWALVDANTANQGETGDESLKNTSTKPNAESFTSPIPPRDDDGGQCKFCVVHMVGVYVINITSLLVITLVLFFYWREILGYFQGTTVAKNKPMPELPDSASSPPPPLDDPTSPDVQLVQPPPTMLMPTPPPPPLPPDLPPPQQVKEPTPAQTPPPANLLDGGTISTKKSHESTGSNYYKQMMRGKKPVASVSQYQLLKKNIKKGKGKHLTHARTKNKNHGSRKAKKEAEVKKFAAEAKKLTKGLPS